MSPTAAVTPTRGAVLHLYAAMLRTSRSFSSYNFRQYFVRQTKDTFRAIQAEEDPEKLRTMYSDAVKELSVLRRSAIVNQLYGGWKLAVEVERKPEDFKDRQEQDRHLSVNRESRKNVVDERRIEDIANIFPRGIYPEL
ncbi:hypothetical protein P691DRAFT_780469 [Macrolepiota fuliginosa MF-IS2]|uniref:Complex 1 LYR protein domain-containing protein n=1 Tax=Macrolepiota fuliginosa MF-IS2 TaxID=1400762 RepID=A0A9P6C9W8_9AGAR|nr:hypothetical protein P691DRAFT_780469 [Macrolepiota fuliginosa MF-IS2]